MPKVLIDVAKDSPLGSAWLDRRELISGKGVILLWNSENNTLEVRVIESNDPALAGVISSETRLVPVGE